MEYPPAGLPVRLPLRPFRALDLFDVLRQRGEPVRPELKRCDLAFRPRALEVGPRVLEGSALLLAGCSLIELLELRE